MFTGSFESLAVLWVRWLKCLDADPVPSSWGRSRTTTVEWYPSWGNFTWPKEKGTVPDCHRSTSNGKLLFLTCDGSPSINSRGPIWSLRYDLSTLACMRPREGVRWTSQSKGRRQRISGRCIMHPNPTFHILREQDDQLLTSENNYSLGCTQTSVTGTVSRVLEALSRLFLANTLLLASLSSCSIDQASRRRRCAGSPVARRMTCVKINYSSR